MLALGFLAQGHDPGGFSDWNCWHWSGSPLARGGNFTGFLTVKVFRRNALLFQDFK